jgi:hypothetical protein
VRFTWWLLHHDYVHGYRLHGDYYIAGGETMDGGRLVS